MRKLKSAMKGKLVDGKAIGGQGRLTDDHNDDLQKWYRVAIRKNCINHDAMEKAVWAVLHHYVRNTKGMKGQHNYCPTGEYSWCKWQRDQAKQRGEDNEYSDKRCLPPVFLDLLLPIWKALADRKLLERCLGDLRRTPTSA